MREQVRGYRERLDNTTETVVAREERNREAKKGLREKTREINRLHDERARLMNELKARSSPNLTPRVPTPTPTPDSDPDRYPGPLMAMLTC